MTVFALMFITLMSLCSYGIVGFYFLQFCKRSKSLKINFIKILLSVFSGAACYYFRILALGVLYLFVLLSIFRIIYWIVKRIKKLRLKGKSKQIIGLIYKTGIIPLLIIVFFFSYGYSNINNVRQTAYTVESHKLKEDYKVVFISDIHYSTVQKNEILNKKIKEINALKPDLVILGGDIVEEGTSKTEMRECFNALGNIKSAYGTFYIYGNHDRQRYSLDPSFTENELKDAIETNGIVILKEDYVKIGEDLILLGREDLGAKSDRIEIENLDTGRFVLTADHQPNSTKENESVGTDLLLSGHTHAGQIFPIGYFDFLFRGFVYGEYKVDNMTVLVSSGFAGWGFPIRTQGISEYLVVHLRTNNILS